MPWCAWPLPFGFGAARQGGGDGSFQSDEFLAQGLCRGGASPCFPQSGLRFVRSWQSVRWRWRRRRRGSLRIACRPRSPGEVLSGSRTFRQPGRIDEALAEARSPPKEPRFRSQASPIPAGGASPAWAGSCSSRLMVLRLLYGPPVSAAPSAPSRASTDGTDTTSTAASLSYELRPAEDIGRVAGERAAARVQPPPRREQKNVTVVFRSARSHAASSTSCGSINGASVARQDQLPARQ